ncbi:hypothetical protein L615_001200000080 [Nocardioides sp. J9]|uniref:hypothetical protein n=1 Tax=Nocardioides sp. J9 TaxID=935844 RepID=UPI0011A7A9D7|nr:hypothetical protein [Nocardioides sp. J9]TWH03139.1 hypothetical protein L615_001200000080 [Nocardioides sp. J9]
MSNQRLTRPMVERTLWILDNSGLLDIIAPEPPKGRAGRRGRVRDNTRLWALGVTLCTRTGRETTVRGVYDVLTEALPRDLQWELGILRPLTSRSHAKAPANPEQARLTKTGKPRKEIWAEDGYERISYDDLHNVTTRLRKELDYGPSVADRISDAEREQRRARVEAAVDQLIGTTLIPRASKSVAIDATGQWSWTIGSKREKKQAQDKLAAGQHHGPSEEDADVLEVADIHIPDETDDNDDTAENTSADTEAPDKPTPEQRRCLDAAWGYKTSKSGEKEVGFGFHQHTIVRTPDPRPDARPEPLLVEGIAVVPANEDVVAASLRLIDRVHDRQPIARIAGDSLYTNLKAERWAVPLAQRGIEQILAMRSNNAGVMDLNGALLHYGWMHCPAAPMDRRPLPGNSAAEETAEHYDAVDDFKATWAFDRKESGLGRNGSTKWICPAMAGRVGCWARGNDNVTVARELGLPIITPPEDWQTRPCCTNKTMDFTPDPANPHHQRKLMQREYVGTRRWRRAFNLRSSVEGAFGILKNPSRQRMRRGHNRLPGLAMANLINGFKVAIYNEEQLRIWHENHGLGPADHPLLQPDPADWGFVDLTKDQATDIDQRHLAAARGENVTALPDAA